MLFVLEDDLTEQTAPVLIGTGKAVTCLLEFRLEIIQTLTGLESGSYRFSISIQGGDGGETEIYAYALVDGELVSTAPLEVTVWDSWDTGTIPGIRVEEGQSVTVGVFVKCRGAGNGAWGKIDAAMLNAEG